MVLGSSTLSRANRDLRYQFAQLLNNSYHSIRSLPSSAQSGFKNGVQTAEAGVTKMRSRTTSISQMAKYMANDAIKANLHVIDGTTATRDQKLAAFADRLAAKKVLSARFISVLYG